MTPRRVLLLGLALAALVQTPAAAQEVAPVEPGTTFVLVHGAWGGAWDWRTVDRLLTDRGHEVYRVTLTGLGKRSHLASADIGLETHILDVVNEILWEELTDVVLVGHSYGGMVITGAADSIPDQIRELVYIDAFVPEPGARLVDPEGLEPGEGIVDGLVLPTWEPADKPIPKDMPHPLKSFTDTLALEHGIPNVPGRYILTREAGAETDDFQLQADRAAARGWPVTVMEAGHVPNRTHPEALVELMVGERWP